MVKTETLAWLAKSGHQSERFVQRVGRRCREASVSSVAEEFGLHWETVKSLDIQYMQRQLDDHPIEPPRVIGKDEISVLATFMLGAVGMFAGALLSLIFLGEARYGGLIAGLVVAVLMLYTVRKLNGGGFRDPGED